MATPLEYFRIFAREFDDVIDDDVLALIAAAELFVVVDSLDAARADAARALYAAHTAWLGRYAGNGGGNRGVVLSEKDGEQERRYGAIDGSQTFLGQSTYGQQYQRLCLPIAGVSIMTRMDL